MSNNENRLFLLDAFALIYRGYFAFAKNPRINTKGLDTSAILGFSNTLVEVLKKENPTHIAVVFDTPKPTFRHIEYKEYKAHRDAMPEGIQVAIPYIHKILDAFKIPQLFVDGFEADDVIGTLAKKAEKEGFEVYMMTSDKDYAQLVSENIYMYKPSRMGNGVEIMGVPEVLEKFEIERVNQVIDYLGMMGDASDNIPGIKGVGDKTAKKFIKAYGSMEGLFENVEDIKGKLKEKVVGSKEIAFLSKKLVTIDVNAPIDFVADDVLLKKAKTEELINLFKDLEFKRLMETVENMYGLDTTISSKKGQVSKNKIGVQGDLFASLEATDTIVNTFSFDTIDNVDHLYQLVDTPIARKMLLKNLLNQKSVCFDTETTSLNTFEAQIVGIAFSWKKGKGYYLSIPKEETFEILQEFEEFFYNENIEKVGQNLKYDLKVLANDNHKVKVKGPFFDTMIAHYLISPSMRHNMDVLAETYLNYSPVPIDALLGKNSSRTMRDVPIKDQVEYAVEDADITFQLKEIFSKKLEEAKNVELFRNVEMPLMEVLVSMELEGIRIDTEALAKMSTELDVDIKSLEKKVYEEADVEFNLSSPKQTGEVLFGKMKLVEKPKKTKTGQYKTSEAILSKLSKEHSIVRNILEYRTLVKLKSTYVDSLPKEIKPKTGRIHTSYSQTTAVTGRLSSTNPNLQNIPIRTEKGKLIRKAFVARDDNHVLMAADYSQVELRLIAEMSKDKEMMKSFKNNEDIHIATASKVFGIPLTEVTKKQRSHAKTVNFGIIYGVSATGLSEQTKLSRKEAGDLIETYYKNYSQLKAFMDEKINFAREYGYVETILGRRRYLQDINSRNIMVRSAAERNAVNAPIQGSAADIIKIAMITIKDRFDKENIKSKMLLQVHDELVFDVLKTEIDIVMPIVKYEMENAIKTEVPLTVDIEKGYNWLDAH